MSAKNSQELGADNWLHIATHSLSKYVIEGGQLHIRPDEAGVRITLVQVGGEDGRLHDDFKALIKRPHSP